MKQSQAINNTAAFFPNYFKKIGFIVILITVAFLFIGKYFFPEISVEQKNLIKVLFFNALILGLFFIAWSRDKFEDEMTMQMRMRAVAFTFMTAVFYLIISPFINLILQEATDEISGQQIMLFMLFMYILFYRLQKRALK